MLTPPVPDGQPRSGATDDRWASVGHSAHRDARAAVRDAFAQLDAPGELTLLVVFAAPSFDRDAVAAAITEVAPGTATIGCTSAGEFSDRGCQDGSVVIMALGGAGLRCATALAPVIDGDARSAAAAAASCVEGLDLLESTVMIILADGRGIDQDDLVRGAYDTVGPAIPLVGGCACGEVLQEGAAVFHQPASADPVLARAVAAERSVSVAVITSTGPIGIGVGHGFEVLGEPLVVTSSGRDVLATLDEQPALDVYLRRHGAVGTPAGDISTDDEAFATLAQPRPIGVARRGRVEPRSVISCDPGSRTLQVGAAVPQGGLVWLLEGDSSTALAAVDRAADEALAGLAGVPARAVVVFDCGARRGLLGPDGIRAEVDRFRERAAAPLAGLYTFGEIARTSGSTGFHNFTAVMLAIG